jgi:hypothetical protein
MSPLQVSLRYRYTFSLRTVAVFFTFPGEYWILFFSIAQRPLVGQGLLIIEAAQSHSVSRTTHGRTSLDEWSARRRDLYLTTHSTHKRQTAMPPAGFEPTIRASERPNTHALDRTAAKFWNSAYNYVITAFFNTFSLTQLTNCSANQRHPQSRRAFLNKS